MKEQFKKVQEQIEMLLRMLDNDYSHVWFSDKLKDIYGDFLKLKYYIESKEKKEDK